MASVNPAAYIGNIFDKLVVCNENICSLDILFAVFCFIFLYFELSNTIPSSNSL